MKKIVAFEWQPASEDNKSTAKKSSTNKSIDADKVTEYLYKLSHPQKAEIEVVRAIIKGADKKITERIKWNAPSYYYKEDMVTFNLRATQYVHLVFHHPAIVKIKSELLQGDYIDRRMAYFTNMDDVQSKKRELKRVVKELMKLMNSK